MKGAESIHRIITKLIVEELWKVVLDCVQVQPVLRYVVHKHKHYERKGTTGCNELSGSWTCLCVMC